MKKQSPFVVAYYQSAECVADLAALVAKNLAMALDRRKMIVDDLNESFAALGITPSARDLREQARFVSGAASPDEMAWLMRLYAHSVQARAEDAPRD